MRIEDIQPTVVSRKEPLGLPPAPQEVIDTASKLDKETVPLRLVKGNKTGTQKGFPIFLMDPTTHQVERRIMGVDNHLGAVEL